MTQNQSIESLLPELLEWRHYLHSIPETAYEEHKTAEFIDAKLKSFGIKTVTGFAKTGVIGILKKGDSSIERSVAIRADMDALNITEENSFAWCSTHSGKMHACGHDGHMAMMLGAAKYLSESSTFNGTVYFIFQPAEENEGGGQLMVEEGLFERFPVQSVYGMHNFPILPEGQFAVCKGPMMAAYDIFDIYLTGVGGHAASPHLVKDPIIAATAIIQQLQTIISRNVKPSHPAVLSITGIEAGTAYNIIPSKTRIYGTTRHFDKSAQEVIQSRMEKIVRSVCETFEIEGELDYQKRYPAVINTDKETDFAVKVASELVGPEKVDPEFTPFMGSEDFAFMLEKVPGTYIGLGSQKGPDTANLHQSKYDFNDDILTLGVNFWVNLVESLLNKKEEEQE